MNKNSAMRGGISLPRSLEIPERVAKIWAYRERIEFEASDLFSRLAMQLKSLGADQKVIQLATQASQDEIRHAALCRQIIYKSKKNIRRETPQLGLGLGPTTLTPRERTLYTCVAISCVTETLSTALLLEMQKCAETALIRQTVHSILEDEIAHSRIGWAHLASEAKYSNIAWLSAFVPQMFQEAIAMDVPSMITAEDSPDLSPWGILPHAHAKTIMLDTMRNVILPGLQRYGIKLTA